MPKSISLSAIFEAIKKGVETALHNYYEMSGENDVGAIPESYFQTKVADSLAAMRGHYITLEDSYRRVLEDAGANAKAINNLKRPQERADILIRWGNRESRIIVELKRAIIGRALATDAAKIREALKSTTRLEGGILVGLFRKNPTEDTIQKKSKSFSIRKEVNAVKFDFVNQKYGEGENGKPNWAGAGIFYIQ